MGSDLLLHNIASQYQLEIDEEGEFLDQVRLLAAVLIVGSNEDHVWSVENRRPCRQSLGQMNLVATCIADRRLHEYGVGGASHGGKLGSWCGTRSKCVNWSMPQSH